MRGQEDDGAEGKNEDEENKEELEKEK